MRRGSVEFDIQSESLMVKNQPTVEFKNRESISAHQKFNVALYFEMTLSAISRETPTSQFHFVQIWLNDCYSTQLLLNSLHTISIHQSSTTKRPMSHIVQR